MENSRIEQHIMFVIKNLGYENPNGRLSILNVLDQLVTKVPAQIFDNYSETTFFTLLLRTLSEDNQNCINLLEKIILILFES